MNRNFEVLNMWRWAGDEGFGLNVFFKLLASNNVNMSKRNMLWLQQLKVYIKNTYLLLIYICNSMCLNHWQKSSELGLMFWNRKSGLRSLTTSWPEKDRRHLIMAVHVWLLFYCISLCLQSLKFLFCDWGLEASDLQLKPSAHWGCFPRHRWNCKPSNLVHH